MMFYRGKNNVERSDELNSIIEQSEQQGGKKKTSCRGNVQVLMSPAFLRPFKCIGILQMLYNMSGFLIIHTYTDTFLEVLVDMHPGMVSYRW